MHPSHSVAKRLAEALAKAGIVSDPYVEQNDSEASKPRGLDKVEKSEVIERVHDEKNSHRRSV